MGKNCIADNHCHDRATLIVVSVRKVCSFPSLRRQAKSAVAEHAAR
jgi:hypothetical protein